MTVSGGPVLQTERLRLRPVSLADVDWLHGLWTEPDVRRFLWDGEVIPHDRAANVVAATGRDFAERGYGFWIVERRLSQEPIGFVGFRPSELDPDDVSVPELLFGLRPRSWHQGFATEAAHAVLAHGFETLGFARVVAATDTPNTGSARVMDRLGMRLVRRGDLHGLDTLFYELHAADFRGGRRPGGSPQI
jgi:RimJ/RimL family protein N-acetyltransferase